MVLQDAYGYEKTESFELNEPDPLVEASLEIKHETNENQNGSISLSIEGGTGTLSFAWSNGAMTADISDLEAGEYMVVVTDENGCSEEFGPYIVENATVSVLDLEFVNSLDIYPIPAREYVNFSVELSEVMPTQLRVLDTGGRVVWDRAFDQKKIDVRIEVVDVPAGIYFIDFGTDRVRSLEKVVVVR